jgi:hypothetical protein
MEYSCLSGASEIGSFHDSIHHLKPITVQAAAEDALECFTTAVAALQRPESAKYSSTTPASLLVTTTLPTLYHLI